MKKIILYVFLLILVSCGKSQNIVYVDNAHISPTDVTNLQWDKSNFPLRIVVPTAFQSQYGAAIQGAADTWNQAMGFTVFTIVYDGVNLVYDLPSNYSQDTACINGTCGNLYSFVMHPNWFSTVNSGVLAITSFSYDKNTARMVHADILFNAKNFQFTVPNGTVFSPVNSMDTQSVLVHELGHFLGLRHVCRTESERQTSGSCAGDSSLGYSSCIAAKYTWNSDCTGSIGDAASLDANSIMNRTLGNATIKRTISAKDLYYINNLYQNKCTVANSLITHATNVIGNLPNCEVTACDVGTPSLDKTKCE